MRIIICGLNGAGKSTLGRALVKQLHYEFRDIEDYYFPKTDDKYEYSVQRTEEEVAALLLKDLEENEDIVLASVRGNYKEQIEKLFDLAVYIDIPKDIRMARVRKRSNDKFGNRMLPGGDLYESEERFFKMVEARSDDHAKRWLTELSCPVISIDGTAEVDTNVEILVNAITGCANVSQIVKVREKMDGIKWLFFDIGSTLADESLVYEKIYRKIAKAANKTYDFVYEKALEYYKQNKRGDKEVSKLLGVEKPIWEPQYERLYDDAEECLEQLSRKYKIGIIANQIPGTAQRLEKFGIRKYFDVIVASAEEGVAKPDRRIFEIALERAKCSVDQAVMIGDRIDYDIVPAKNMGMKTIWVKQGMGQYWILSDESERPDYEVDSLSELLEVL